MRSVFLIASLLAPAWVSAQTLTLTFPPNNQEARTVGPANCDQSIPVTWTLTTAITTQACSELRFWLTAGNCGEAPGEGDYELDESVDQASWGVTTLTGTVNFEVDRLPFFTAAENAIDCRTSQVQKSARLCARGEVAGTSTLGVVSCSEEADVTGSARVSFDAEPPGAPGIGEVVSVDSGLRIEVQPVGDTAEIQVEYRPLVESEPSIPGDGGEPDAGTEPGATGGDWSPSEWFNAKTVRRPEVRGLTNGVVYEVRVVGRDEAGNRSGPSESKTGKPEQTVGFFGECLQSGCGEEGGCAAAGALSLFPAAAAVIGLWLLRRQRR